jgi:mRNA-degrading endonuclease toxin of MazEF toxin-antitoxin module
MIKEFLTWINLKEKLHDKKRIVPFLTDLDLWWIIFGENVGSEINGKSKFFSRPGLVLKKLSRGFYLVAPTTTQKKDGSWYVEITQGNKKMYVCLHQIRTIDYRRVSSRLGQMDENDFQKVTDAFYKLYKL